MQSGETEKPGGSPASTPVTTPLGGDGPEVKWSASEYIDHQKSANWYLLLLLAAAVLAALTYFITGDVISTVAIVVVSAIFAFAASRQPRTLNYAIDHDGIHIGEKFYSYEMFKSFSIMEEEAIYSIFLIPMKRLMPGVSIYYPPEQEDKILGVLSTYLPHEDRPADMVDRFARRIRF